MITAFGSLDTAVGAIRVGAYDFITKPFDVETLAAHARRARPSTAGFATRSSACARSSSDARGLDQMIGSSAPIQKVKELIDRVADDRRDAC